ncbi:nucleoside/nucleotide kinase family protein [Acuticoccus sediminis]|uniref:nucleoside/nucleotide kinase family protein n=1 Tax=Acuticoccus sediminis TaxID=2184697 RepID=UPI001FD43F87|nr:nucleoside/nucleotide kinase family protein [Acuticoccus sediminis]
MTALSANALADRLAGEIAADGPRRIVAIAGPPGAGKSTLADWLAARIDAAHRGRVAVMGMDGFHFDDRVLLARGDRPRKGAPHTFDVDGLAAMLARIAADDGRPVAVPVFDRGIEIARAGAAIIEPGVRLVLLEGNYLLLDDPAWRPLAPMFDFTVMIAVAEATLRRRLAERWASLSGDALTEKLEGNDFPNMRLVLHRSRPVDFTVTPEPGER